MSASIPPPRAATLADVAALVGVSTRTVSRVVNNEPGISTATRRRVHEVVQTLGYRPNMAARRLVTKRSEMVGLVIPHFDNPFFPMIAHGVEDACAEVGLTLVVGQTRADSDRQGVVIESLIAHGIDGLIIFPELGSDGQINDAMAFGTAVVTVNWPHHLPGTGQVQTPFRAGASAVADHFAANGHRSVAMIANALEASPFDFRRQGFVERCRALDLSVVVHDAKEVTVQEGSRAAAHILNDHSDVTALFAYNDLLAIGALRACHELGRSVPRDCAVVGFDDIDIAASLTPSLSSVSVDRALIGRRAVDVLTTMLEAPGFEPPVVELDAHLVVRESSDLERQQISRRAGKGHRSPTG